MPSLPIKSSYRPDIDGLRAIAVLSVILFHINKQLIPGGFVGVDIFFVISGYLISLHIFQEIEAGQFSIIEFYRRRIKRIAPPMLLVVFVVMSIAQFVMIPEDAERVADSALWSLSSLANVYFWRHQDTSYFAAASSELPLLHLWSLGVEEQFYILWPLLLMLTYRRSRTNVFFVLAIFAALSSFIAGQLWFERDSSFVYYMLPTRAGELLIGAICSLVVLRGVEKRLSGTTIKLMASVGLLMVVGSLFLLAEDIVFPGLLAIPPTLGTALLLLAGHCTNSPLSKVLSCKPVVWIGLVSYSAYLWHWPLVSFFRYGHAEVGLITGTSIFALTFMLAWLTYLFIERPARSSKASAIRILLLQYVIPAGVIAVISLGAMYIDGYGFRWQSEEYISRLDAFRDQTRPAYKFDYVCQRQRVQVSDTRDERCVTGTDSDIGPRVILWGDSNAAHYIGVVSAIAREAGFRVRNLELGSCPPLFDDPALFVAANRLRDCRDSAEPVAAAVRASDVVIISASWTSYINRSDHFLDSFFSTTRSLTEAGKLVVLIGKAPVVAGYDRRCKEKALSYPLLECTLSAAKMTDDVASVNTMLKAYAERTPNVEYFDVIPYLCRGSLCSAFDAEGKPLYYDQSHLSLPGSWEIGRMILHREGVPALFSRIVNWRRS